MDGLVFWLSNVKVSSEGEYRRVAGDTDYHARRRPRARGQAGSLWSRMLLAAEGFMLLFPTTPSTDSPPAATLMPLWRSVSIPQANNGIRILGGRGSADRGLLPTPDITGGVNTPARLPRPVCETSRGAEMLRAYSAWMVNPVETCTPAYRYGKGGMVSAMVALFALRTTPRPPRPLWLLHRK